MFLLGYFVVQLCMCPLMIGRQLKPWTPLAGFAAAVWYCFMLWVVVVSL
jgi:hypothetical protein